MMRSEKKRLRSIEKYKGWALQEAKRDITSFFSENGHPRVFRAVSQFHQFQPPALINLDEYVVILEAIPQAVDVGYGKFRSSIKFIVLSLRGIGYVRLEKFSGLGDIHARVRRFLRPS